VLFVSIFTSTQYGVPEAWMYINAIYPIYGAGLSLFLPKLHGVARGTAEHQELQIGAHSWYSLEGLVVLFEGKERLKIHDELVMS